MLKSRNVPPQAPRNINRNPNVNLETLSPKQAKHQTTDPENPSHLAGGSLPERERLSVGPAPFLSEA